MDQSRLHLLLQRATGLLRKALVVWQLLGRPFATLAAIAADTLRLAKRWMRPPGLTVVLCGADGSGKSTAASALIERLSVTFSPPKGRHFHWKPPVFSARRMTRRSPTTSPHAAAPRNLVLSWLYFIFHWLEFFLGSFLRV